MKISFICKINVITCYVLNNERKGCKFHDNCVISKLEFCSLEWHNCYTIKISLILLYPVGFQLLYKLYINKFFETKFYYNNYVLLTYIFLLFYT